MILYFYRLYLGKRIFPTLIVVGMTLMISF